jgi:signal transduction histidine kinase
MIRKLHNLSRSVFIQLLLIILTAGLLINLVVVGSFGRLQQRSASTYHRIAVHYIQTLLADIGNPPSLQQAEEISSATGFVISYDKNGRVWQTPGAAWPLPEPSRYRLRQLNERTVVGFFRGYTLIRHSLDEGALTFVAPRSEAVERDLRLWLLFVLTALSVILGGAYLLIRRALKPLHGMKAGMEAVHAGRLDHRVPQNGATEFRKLAEAFNTMTIRVRDMLHSKERLLLDVSHELRSPIARMKVALAMMPEDAQSLSLREDLCEMERMVTTILESARLRHTADTLRKTSVSLGELVAESIESLLYSTPGVRIEPCADVLVRIDKDKMRTVIQNIVENAIKYSSAESGPVRLFWEAEAAEVTLTVQDHGIGIPAEDLPRIFEPFFRVDDSRSRLSGGFGLGLSLAKAIVEAHGGIIDASSSPGGTRMMIVLPREFPGFQSKRGHTLNCELI